MPEVTLRAPTVADAEEIADVLNAHGLATAGAASESPDGVTEWFGFEELDPGHDMRVALDDNDAIVGYADVSDQGHRHETFSIDLRVRPDAPHPAAALLDAMEARARSLARPGAVARLFVNEQDAALGALATERGYSIVRSSFRMEISIAAELPEPAWPTGITPRAFVPADEERVYTAHREAFTGHWGFTPATRAQWRAWNLGASSDPSLWRVAWARDEVAGLCINRPERGDDVGWVDVLAVRQPWRRRGLGRALLLDAFHTFRGLGRRRVGLGVDAENTTGAVRLYESAGMSVVNRSDTWERTI